MRKIVNIVLIIFSMNILIACDPDAFLDDLFEQPVAAFDIEKKEYNVFESVKFTNTGKGQKFVVYPGDEGHLYKNNTDVGFPTTSDGKFSYSYQEPGIYNAVWVASSVDKDGNIITDVDSVKVEVVARDGGLESFSIQRIYKMPEYTTATFYNSEGIFISPDTILCPILFESWRNASFNTVKIPLGVKFSLSSTLAELYWIHENVPVLIESERTSSKFFWKITVMMSSTSERMFLRKKWLRPPYKITSNWWD